MPSRVLLASAIAVALFGGTPVPAAADPMTPLKADVISRYGDIAVRPGLALAKDNACAPAADDVDIQIYVVQFLPLDQKKMRWGFDGYLRLWWHDHRLAFNSSAVDGGACLESLELTGDDRKMIWQPDIYVDKAIKFQRGLGVNSANGLGQALKVSPDGSIWSSQQTLFELSCTGMNFEMAPFDSQVCTITLGLYSQTGAQVKLRWRPFATALMVGGDGPLCLSDWIVTHIAARNTTYTFASGDYTYAEAEVEFTRVPSSLISVYFIPSIFFVMLSSLGFFINPAATPARVALGVITILAVITNRNALDRELPSAKSTWLSSFLYVSLIFNLFAFVEQVLVNLGIALHAWVLQNRKRTADAQQAARKGLEGTYTDAGLLLERIVAWRLEIVPMFEVLDVDSDGMVSSKEFRYMLHTHLGVDADSKVLDECFHRLSGEKKSTVSRTTLLVKLTKLARRSHQAGQKAFLARADSMGSDAMRAAAQRGLALGGAVGHTPAGDAGTGEEMDEEERQALEDPIRVEIQQGACTQARDSRAADAASVTFADEASERASESFRDSIRTHTAKRHRKIHLRDKAVRVLEKRLLSRKAKLAAFPCLAHMQFLDHYMRVLVPLAYAIVVVYYFSLVGFGRVAYDKLTRVPCYV